MPHCILSTAGCSAAVSERPTRRFHTCLSNLPCCSHARRIPLRVHECSHQQDRCGVGPTADRLSRAGAAWPAVVWSAVPSSCAIRHACIGLQSSAEPLVSAQPVLGNPFSRRPVTVHAWPQHSVPEDTHILIMLCAMHVRFEAHGRVRRDIEKTVAAIYNRRINVFDWMILLQCVSRNSGPAR